MQIELADTTSDEILASGAGHFTVQEARDLVALFARVTQ